MGYLTATFFASVLIMPALLCSGDKVDVYVLMGQSNMLGEGKIGPDNVNGSLGYAVKTEHKYPYLWNHSSNTWAVREDVRYVEVIGSGNSSFEHSNLAHNEFMTVTGKTIGPELGIGNYVGKLGEYFTHTILIRYSYDAHMKFDAWEDRGHRPACQSYPVGLGKGLLN